MSLIVAPDEDGDSDRTILSSTIGTDVGVVTIDDGIVSAGLPEYNVVTGGVVGTNTFVGSVGYDPVVAEGISVVGTP